MTIKNIGAQDGYAVFLFGESIAGAGKSQCRAKELKGFHKAWLKGESTK